MTCIDCTPALTYTKCSTSIEKASTFNGTCVLHVKWRHTVNPPFWRDNLQVPTFVLGNCGRNVEMNFYGDLVYKLQKIVGSNNFSAQFIKIISHYKKIGYNINVLQQTACLVVNQITVGNFAFLFNCTPVGRTSDSIMVPT